MLPPIECRSVNREVRANEGIYRFTRIHTARMKPIIHLLLSEERNEAVHQNTVTIRWFRSQVATSAPLVFSVNTGKCRLIRENLKTLPPSTYRESVYSSMLHCAPLLHTTWGAYTLGPLKSVLGLPKQITYVS